MSLHESGFAASSAVAGIRFGTGILRLPQRFFIFLGDSRMRYVSAYKNLKGRIGFLILAENQRLWFSMSRSFGLLTVLIVAIMGAGQGSALAQNRPHAVIKSPLWNFGYLPQKCEVSHRFYLHNAGAAPLSVLKIEPGCSCTSVSDIRGPIDPGDSAAIVVTFKSGRYHGLVKKAAKVHTDDPEMTAQNVRIVSNVVRAGEPTGSISVVPQNLTWRIKNGIIVADADTLRITNDSAGVLAVALLYAPEEFVTKMNIPPSIGSGEAADLILHISKKAVLAESGWLSTTLAFAGKDTTIITIPIEIEK
jgi:hypothetical protein